MKMKQSRKTQGNVLNPSILFSLFFFKKKKKHAWDIHANYVGGNDAYFIFYKIYLFIHKFMYLFFIYIF